MKAVNREAWLNACAAKIQPWLDEIKHPVVMPFRITCGFPSKGALSQKKRRIGECWPTEVSTDDHVEMFISPLLDDATEVAATVAHELLHASGLKGHRANFAAAAKALGLDGPATATEPGEAFKQRITDVLAALGPYPHSRIDYTKSPRKVQGTRLIKVSCTACEGEEEPYIVRMSQATLDRGAPICPIHTEPMEVSNNDGNTSRGSSTRPIPGEETEAEHPATPDSQTPTHRGGKARSGKAPRERVITDRERTRDDVPGAVQAQCAGGDGFRACRDYKGLLICSRCWRRRQSIADNRGGKR